MQTPTASRLARDRAGCVTASETINHISLRITLPCHEIVYRIVDHDGQMMDHLVGSGHIPLHHRWVNDSDQQLVTGARSMNLEAAANGKVQVCDVKY